MCAMDYVRELHEANDRLAQRLAQRDLQAAKNLVAALTGNLVELRWLEQDYEDERMGDWTR